MSTFEAIRGVSDTLRRLLLDRMELPADLVGACPVTVGQPRSDVLNPVEAAEPARVNLFLYRTQQNAALRNQDPPGAGQRNGAAVPPLSLDLFYLVTAYGTLDEEGRLAETLAHALLGSAMRVFHDHAVVTDRLTTARPPVGRPILHRAVRDDFERLKLSPEPLSLEDLSKIWTALTLPFRAGAAYQVSVVQIASRRARRSAPPVLEYRRDPPRGPQVFVTALPRPAIRSVGVRRPGDPAGSVRTMPFVRVGDTVVIDGEQLAGKDVAVRVGPAEYALGQTTDPGRIEFLLGPSADLNPGAHVVEVVRPMEGVPGPGVRSNQAVLMLVPRVAPPSMPGPRRLQVTGDRLTAPGATGQVAVGPADVPDTAYLSATPAAVTVPLPDTLPASGVPVLVSGPPPAWATLPNPLTLDVTVGAAAPVGVTIPRPTGPADAAVLLENALRGRGRGTTPVRELADARVAASSDGRLLVVAGGLTVPLTFGQPHAALLGLSGAGSATRTGYLSGVCDPFPAVPATTPQVAVSLGAATAEVTLVPRPTSITGCAAALEAAIVGAGPAFAGTRVAVSGGQLLVVPGGPGLVRVTAAATDPRSAADLRLAGDLPVRVRVNGAESVDDVRFDVTQPPGP